MIASPILHHPTGLSIASHLKGSIAKWGRRWWRLACPLCDRPSDARVCEACWPDLERLPPGRCAQCALPLGDPAVSSEHRLCGRCLKNPPAYDAIRTSWVYASPLSDLIHGFKFERRFEHVPLFSEMGIQGLQGSESVWERIQEIDRLCPVPLHRDRWRERGYNQSAIWGQHLAKKLRKPFSPCLLKRLRATKQQVTLNRSARAANVSGAFALARPEFGFCVQNQHIGLVDDVVTTGHTVNEIAKVLKTAGALSVQVLAIARTLEA